MRSAADRGTAPTRADPVTDRLLRHRILSIGTPINGQTADTVTSRLLLLAAETDAPITLYINSPGGSVPAGMAIYDTMQHIRNPITTIGLGYCASMAQLLLAAGTPGRRAALPHSRMMLHLPSITGAAPANASEELRHTRQQISDLIARHTHRTAEEVIRNFSHDRWFSAVQAQQYGLIDEILHPRHTRSSPSRRAGAPLTSGEPSDK
ncbi:ClpP family protease [Streptomyces eurythermus]|uniref:ClpP family protease n=1 Tax=Streptomyces eurythermus TaxID=42237 RepID=UPI0036D3362E